MTQYVWKLYNAPRRFANRSRCLMREAGEHGLSSRALRSIRQAAQFVALVVSSGVSSHSVPASLHRFVSANLEWFQGLDTGSYEWSRWHDSLMNVLVALKQSHQDFAQSSPTPAWNDASVWALLCEVEPSNLVAVCKCVMSYI